MPLSDRDFELNGTHYIVRPLGAMAGWRLLEQIRHQVGGVVGQAELTAALNFTEENAGEATALVGQVLLRLEPAFVDATMQTLFRNVTFRNDQAVNGQPLAGSEDMAFSAPDDPYQLLVRCLAVNFGGSAQRVVSRFSGLLSTTDLSGP